jgi:hypothetical protein
VHQSSFYSVRGRALKSIVETPKTWGSGPDYADRWLPPVSVPSNRSIDIDARAVNAAGDHLSLEVAAPPGLAPIATNILAGPYMVEVQGMRIVGHTGSGLVVTRLHGGRGDVHLVVNTRASRAISIGRGISVVSSLAALSLLGWWLLGAWRRRLAIRESRSDRSA